MSVNIPEVEKTAFDLIMTDDLKLKKSLGKKIWDVAQENGIYPASIHDFYMALGRGEFGGFTVPAVNLRGMTYPLARAMFRVAKRKNSGAFIFELARSEGRYTSQPPAEYSSAVLAAAVVEGFRGPVFIQADHLQVSAKKYRDNPRQELDDLKGAIVDYIAAGFYNIDIDSSTLVDLAKTDVAEQQRSNYEACAELTKFIRQKQPSCIEISVGGEIGEVGAKNSTPEDLRAFMEGLKKKLGGATGISKISVQTGTSHGGVVLPDGTMAQVKLDFETLKTLSKIARDEFGLSGAVQHGASTLPAELFHKFPEVGTAEVHLATEFQNIIYESRHFPGGLKAQVYNWIKANLSAEKKAGDTEEQFLYKTRKKAFGPFKKDIMGLPGEAREAIASEVEAKFDFIFRELGSVDNKQLVEKHVPVKRVGWV